MRYWIESIIRDVVTADIHFDLIDVDRAASAIATLVEHRLAETLEEEAKRSYGAFGDGLYEAIEVVRRELSA